ncbi:MAG: dephospho-CoA kinase [Chlorobiaceae bacterium]
MKSDSPFLVGVTGGLGSGKSTLCRFLAGLGCALFEADRVARDLQLHDPQVIEGIKALFGEEVYSFDVAAGPVLDRKAVAAAVFSSSEKLEALNRIIHPKVFCAFEQAVLDAAREGSKILVKEAAILFESGGSRRLDAVVVVAADMERRIQRAVEKGMGSRDEVMRRIATQWPEEKLIERADYVIFNNGTLEELQKESRELYEKLLARAVSTQK